MKKLKIFFVSFITLFAFLFAGGSVFAAESSIETQIKQEVETYVTQGKLNSWHLSIVDDEGYQYLYWKFVHLSNDLEYFSTQTQGQIASAARWYQSEMDDTWKTILANLDIEPEYIEQDKYLGVFWDSYYAGNEDTGYLYLIWTSHYTPSEFVTITSIKESGKTYKLYDNAEAASNLKGNWLTSSFYSYKDYDLTIHITPIAGFEDGNMFGLPLKQNYKFQGFTGEIDDAEWINEVDPTNQFRTVCEEEISFDLGLTPEQNGKNAMQLVTHGYEIIEACEAQSYFDLNFGGYKHYVYFNTTIRIDKIYRVDVSYKVTNDDKPWYQFFLPSDEHEITKSLTSDRVSGGIFGLTNYQGYTEGSFQSTKDSTINYKHRLHLNYDGSEWQFWKGFEFWEADYRRVSQFQILRMNYLVDGEVYDVKVKMDTIEGDTLFILDADLILDTETPYYDFKKFFDDIYRDIKDTWDKYKYVLYAVFGVVGLVIIAWVASKLKKLLLFLFGSGGNELRAKKKE